MKIIYLFTSPSLHGSSVQTKVLNQIKYLNLAGAECRGAFFSTEVKGVTPFNDQVDFIPVDICNWKYFKASGNKRKIMEAVLKYADSNYNEVDFFYFRYPLGGSLLKRFTKKFGKKTFFEHVSKEINEIKSTRKEFPLGLKVSKILSKLEYYYLPIWRELLYGKTIRQNVRFGICNSNEIAEYQSKLADNFYKTIIGGDAVDVNAFKLRKPPIFENELRLVFLKGASGSSDFNGLDRIIHAIANYNGKNEVKLYILGNNLKAERLLLNQYDNINDKIELMPAKNDSELTEFMDSIHLGVSTLGLYRKMLNSTTTIKVREYFAQGLPFLYAYTDPDLNEESKEWALQFSNDDIAIDMQKVIDFAHKVMSDSEHHQKMRKYAEKHLDYGVKMKKLYYELKRL